MDLKWLMIRLILLSLLLNVMFGVYIFMDSPSSPSPPFIFKTELTHPEVVEVNNGYLDSKAWKQYLSELDTFTPHEGIEDDADYCAKVAFYRSEHPLGPMDATGLPQLEDRVIFSDYNPGNLVKDVMKSVARLTMQSHIMDRPEKTPQWHLRHQIDSHFLCPGQRYNHIPGHEHIVYKDQMAKLNKRYGEHYADRKHCFDPWTFMPETLNLAKEEECREYFRRTSAEEDNGEIRWIKKKARNSHNAAGVEIVTREVQSHLEAKYSSKCGHIREHYILQRYIADPLLLDNKKFDFRVYMLVASMDPLMVLYHDGFLRVSLVDFDTKSNDTMAHVTNTQLAKDKLESEHASDSEYAETMSKQMWTFPAFESFMREQGLVSEHWLDTYVRPTMRAKMMHLVRMSHDKMLKHPGVYELFGVDFMFDSSLNLWFLEVNRSPAMQATTEEKGRIQGQMIKDVLEIEMALVKGDVDVVVERSGFTWVIDERQTGPLRFAGLLQKDCV